MNVDFWLFSTLEDLVMYRNHWENSGGAETRRLNQTGMTVLTGAHSLNSTPFGCGRYFCEQIDADILLSKIQIVLNLLLQQNQLPECS